MLKIEHRKLRCSFNVIFLALNFNHGISQCIRNPFDIKQFFLVTQKNGYCKNSVWTIQDKLHFLNTAEVSKIY